MRQALAAAAHQLTVPVLAWALPAAVAADLNHRFAANFVGRSDDELDIVLTVDRRRQLDASACHRSQSADNLVLRRRLELLGTTEYLRYVMAAPA